MKIAPLVAAACLFFGQQAVAAVMADPHRIVFERGTGSSAKLNLINSGDENATYRLSIRTFKMNAEGQMTPIAEPVEADKSAAHMLKVYPREVRQIAPRQSQIVSITARKPAELAIGEYRAYLQITEIQSDDAAGDTFRPEVSVLIPLFVRHGQIDGSAAITDAKVLPGKQPAVDLIMRHEGEKSVYGDLHVYAGSEEIGTMAGVAVYNTTPLRHFRIPLSQPVRGPLRIVLESRGEDGKPARTPAVLTEAQVN